MDRNRILLFGLTGLCVMSLAANVLALRRLRDIERTIDRRNEAPPPPATPPAPVAAKEAAPAPADYPIAVAAPAPAAPAGAPAAPASDDDGLGADGASVRQIMAAIGELRREVDEMRPASLATPWPGAAGAPAVTDPGVANVLTGQAEFKAYWNDIRQVFRARGKLEPEAYQRTVLDNTMNFLGLASDADRNRFKTATQQAVGEIARLRGEFDHAQTLLPPKENKALYDQQRKLLRDQYDVRMREARSIVRRELDSKSPRHDEFADRLDTWLRELGK